CHGQFSPSHSFLDDRVLWSILPLSVFWMIGSHLCPSLMLEKPHARAYTTRSNSSLDTGMTGHGSKGLSVFSSTSSSLYHLSSASDSSSSIAASGIKMIPARCAGNT
ncbi:hypothetical protein S245_031976, partial [Arachis hypogaea]